MSKFILTALSCIVISGGSAFAQDIELPKPVMTGGMSLNDALAQRKTVRDLSEKDLSVQQISNVLWASNGLNRPAEGKYTAPTARNRQELELYIVLPTGAYSYDAKLNKLVQVSNEKNLLQASGAFGRADIIIVCDKSKANDKFADVDSGFIGQNAYLFCAANGMGACFKGSVNKALVPHLKLPETKAALYTVSIGLLKDSE